MYYLVLQFVNTKYLPFEHLLFQGLLVLQNFETKYCMLFFGEEICQNHEDSGGRETPVYLVSLYCIGLYCILIDIDLYWLKSQRILIVLLECISLQLANQSLQATTE